MSDGEKKMPIEDAESFFADFYRGKHHIPGSGLHEWGWGWYVNHYGCLATYDFSELTRLVFMAHDRCVRVEVGAVNMQYIRIAIHPRLRNTGATMTQHPTLADALASWRERNHEPTP
jgi:hypothetical protein